MDAVGASASRVLWHFRSRAGECRNERGVLSDPKAVRGAAFGVSRQICSSLPRSLDHLDLESALPRVLRGKIRLFRTVEELALVARVAME
jgi:hypothetical protein